MTSPDVRLYATDRDGLGIGDPIDNWIDVDATVNNMLPGSASITLPITPNNLLVAQPGNRIVVVYRGAELMAGPIEYIREHRSLLDDTGAGPGTLTVNCSDDLALIAGRLTYPDPTADAESQTTDAYYTANTQAEIELYDLVDLNAAAGALTDRQIPGLVVDTVHGIGGTFKLATRFEDMGDAMRRVANGGDLGFRTRSQVGGILFTVTEPQDKSTSVVFSYDNGNMLAIDVETEAPTCTSAVVAGDGTGTTRQIVERVDALGAATWFRVEKFVNEQGEADTTILEQAGDDALLTGQERASVHAVLVDGVEGTRYGTDYAINDIVTVVSPSGLLLSVRVTAAVLRANAREGAVLAPLVGPPGMSTDPRWLQQITDLQRRLARTERG